MRFIGIDLAWSSRNPSGVAVMEGDELGLHPVDVRTVTSLEEVVDLVRRSARPDVPVFVAVGAPLVVPNRSGGRKAEELVDMVFGQFEATPRPANRRLLSEEGKVRGEEFVKALKELDISHKPDWKPLERSRKCFEVSPHPSLVALFGLDRSLKYESCKGRSYEERRAALEEYQRLLRKLPDASFPREVVRAEVDGLKGEGLKDVVGLLDACFCAYIAYYAWKSPQECAVLGSVWEGYILTPTLRERREEF